MNLDVDSRELLDAERFELEARELALQADIAEFNAQKRRWEATKGGVSPNNCDCQVVKADLKAERSQLDIEKGQMRVAQSQLKAAQSQLEAAKSQLETAQTQLEKAREQLEIAREHLEAAKAQTDIDNTRLEAAKASLGAAKLRFEAATKQLNAAKSRFEAAKTRLDLASSSIEAEKSQLEDDKAGLKMKVSQVESDKVKLEIKVSHLENDKLELSSELQASKTQVESLFDKVKELEKKLHQKACVEDEKLKPQVVATNHKVINHTVFLDITVSGRKAGRIVIELDFENTPLIAENFRVLMCTREEGIEKPWYYKVFSTGVNFCLINGLTLGSSNIPLEKATTTTTKTLSRPGVVALVDGNGKGGHNCGVFITTDSKCPSNGKEVPFGQVIEGMNVLMEIHNAGNYNSSISEWGQLS